MADNEQLELKDLIEVEAYKFIKYAALNSSNHKDFMLWVTRHNLTDRWFNFSKICYYDYDLKNYKLIYEELIKIVNIIGD